MDKKWFVLLGCAALILGYIYFSGQESDTDKIISTIKNVQTTLVDRNNTAFCQTFTATGQNDLLTQAKIVTGESIPTCEGLAALVTVDPASVQDVSNRLLDNLDDNTIRITGDTAVLTWKTLPLVETSPTITVNFQKLSDAWKISGLHIDNPNGLRTLAGSGL